MHRVDTPTAAASLPAPEAPGAPGYFTKGNIGGGVPATEPGQDFFNMLQEEAANVVLGAGLTLDSTKQNYAQLYEAIKIIAARGPSGLFAPHAQSAPDMTVRIDPGHFFISTALISVAAQNSALITAPVTNPRIDRIVISSNDGLVSVITGTEAASPVPPAMPSTGNVFLVADVYLTTGMTEITDSSITDNRSAGLFGVGNYPGQVMQLESKGQFGANAKSKMDVDVRAALINLCGLPDAVSGQVIAAGATFDKTFSHYLGTSSRKTIITICNTVSGSDEWEIFWKTDGGHSGREIGPGVSSITAETITAPASGSVTVRIKNRSASSQSFYVASYVIPGEAS